MNAGSHPPWLIHMEVLSFSSWWLSFHFGVRSCYFCCWISWPISFCLPLTFPIRLLGLAQHLAFYRSSWYQTWILRLAKQATFTNACLLDKRIKKKKKQKQRNQQKTKTFLKGRNKSNKLYYYFDLTPKQWKLKKNNQDCIDNKQRSQAKQPPKEPDTFWWG